MRPDHAPRLGPACRAFLREGMPDGPPFDTHVAACAFCSARALAARKLAQVLRQPVATPPGLHSRATLEAVQQRIVEQSERSGLGIMLEFGMPVRIPAEVERTFPAGLLEPGIAQGALQGPEPVGVLAWSRLRTRVLGEVRASRTRRLRTRAMALASLAAAAIMGGLLFSERSSDQPSIVITDVAAMPSADYSPMAVLRHGGAR